MKALAIMPVVSPHTVDLNSMAQSERNALMFDLVNWVDLRDALAACAARCNRIRTLSEYADTQTNAKAAPAHIHKAIDAMSRPPR